MALKTSNKNRKEQPEMSTAEIWTFDTTKEWKPIDKLAPHEHTVAIVNTHYTSSVDRYVEKHHLQTPPSNKKVWYVASGIVIITVLLMFI